MNWKKNMSWRPQDVALAALAAIVALAGTLLLYWEALSLPFFFDDMIHLRWLDWHTLPSIWTKRFTAAYGSTAERQLLKISSASVRIFLKPF